MRPTTFFTRWWWNPRTKHGTGSHWKAFKKGREYERKYGVGKKVNELTRGLQGQAKGRYRG